MEPITPFLYGPDDEDDALAGEESGVSGYCRAFADHFGVTLRVESPLPGQVPAYKYEIGEERVVVLDGAMPAERQHFALAHEVAHLLLGHGDELQQDEEHEANQLASELLLPDPPFSAGLHESLRQMKQRFPHASFEAIARRRLAFVPGVLTVIDNGQVRRRLMGEGFTAPASPTELEWALVERCVQERGDVEQGEDELRLRATFVDTGRGVERVLLLVEPEW